MCSLPDWQRSCNGANLEEQIRRRQESAEVLDDDDGEKKRKKKKEKKRKPAHHAESMAAMDREMQMVGSIHVWERVGFTHLHLH